MTTSVRSAQDANAPARPFERRAGSRAKALGAFYTPTHIADILAEWVVLSGSERLLEPSVGDGALVRAAMARARALGRNQLRIRACDVDPAPVREMTRRASNCVETRIADFLALDTRETGRFDAVITNPPFTRNQALSAEKRVALRRRFAVSGAAGLWVYFLLHALRFLAVGGRMAAVVPASALFTNYGRKALGRISGSFAHLELRRISDRPTWVNQAAERGALVLASGFGRGSATLPVPIRWSAVGQHECLYSAPPSAAFAVLAAKSFTLDSVATVRIGLVTGCNRVFLLSERERRTMGIDRADVVPVVARTQHVPGLRTSVGALLEQDRTGGKAWLLVPRDLGERNGPVRNQLAKVTHRRRRDTSWFRKRHPWWCVEIGKPCDAVFTYMNDLGPRLVLGDGRLRCTNTLHQVSFAGRVTSDQRMAAALSLISTFGQLAAEQIGRSYGGGVLKFEIRDARKLPVLHPTGDSLVGPFNRADEALRRGDADVAREEADLALVAPLLGQNWRVDLKEMAEQLSEWRLARRGLR